MPILQLRNPVTANQRANIFVWVNLIVTPMRNTLRKQDKRLESWP